MNQNVERPYDPDGSDAIWRRAKKKYAETGEISPRELNESAHTHQARYHDLINVEATSDAIRILEWKKVRPTLGAIGAILKRTDTWVQDLFKDHFHLRRRAIEATLRIQKLELLEAGLRILQDEHKITILNLASATGKSRHYIYQQLSKFPEIKELLGVGHAEKEESSEVKVDMEEASEEQIAKAKKKIWRKVLTAAMEGILNLGKPEDVTVSTLARTSDENPKAIEAFLLKNRDVAEEILDKDEFRRLFPG